VFANDRTFDDVSLAVFQDFSKKCSNSRTDSKFQDIPGQNLFSRISRTGGRPAVRKKLGVEKFYGPAKGGEVNGTMPPKCAPVYDNSNIHRRQKPRGLRFQFGHVASLARCISQLTGDKFYPPLEEAERLSPLWS
jgi:hypothetical protein